MRFEGFCPETMRFLFENKMNNSKEWYDSHKEEYKKYVYNPFVALIEELTPTMLEIDGQIMIKPYRMISRVRRDTRFTKDKSLYRDNVWIVFLRDKSKMAIQACYWFEIAQRGSSCGVGFYGATPQSMARMREMIMERHPAFSFALKCYESQDQFTIGGEMYKRSKFPDEPENIKTWLDRKNIFFEYSENGFNLAFSKDLPEFLKKSFKLLQPIYDFLSIID